MQTARPQAFPLLGEFATAMTAHVLTTAILGPVWTSSSYGVGGFCFGSFAAHEVCKSNMKKERDGMKRAVEIMDRKKLEKEKQKEEMRAARRRTKEKEDARREAEERRRKERPWWKVW